MSKSRIMGAASSGYNYGANKNSPGNGNGKWQGLWPSVGHARNARLINTRAGGDNRNVVFCMNQLGGVGRISNMFATTADGVKQPCPGAGLNTHTALLLLKSYFNTSEGSVILVGKKETLTSDNVDYPERFDSIKHHYPGTTEYEALPSHIKQAVDQINALQIKAPLREGGEPAPHVVGFASFAAQAALIPDYGKLVYLGPRNGIMMYQSADAQLAECVSELGFTAFQLACATGGVAAAPESGGVSLALAAACAGCDIGVMATFFACLTS